jgi:hypothetical protein
MINGSHLNMSKICTEKQATRRKFREQLEDDVSTKLELEFIAHFLVDRLGRVTTIPGGTNARLWNTIVQGERLFISFFTPLCGRPKRTMIHRIHD